MSTRHLGFSQSNGAPSFPMVDKWLQLTGADRATDREGFVGCKTYNSRGQWLRGVFPAEYTSPSVAGMFETARQRGMKRLLSGVCWDVGRPGTDAHIAAGAPRTCFLNWALDFARKAHAGAVLTGPVNEPEMGSWTGTEEGLLEAEYLFGSTIKKAGREWAMFAYASTQNFYAGIVKRLAYMRARNLVPDYLIIHLYGQGSDAPRHIADLKDGLAYAAEWTGPVIVEEYHYGFPTHGNEITARPDLFTTETGLYCADVALAIEAAGWYGMLFLPETLFESADVLNPAGVAFAKAVRARALPDFPKPRAVFSQDQYRAKTYRLLTDHRGPLAALLARSTVKNLTYP